MKKRSKAGARIKGFIIFLLILAAVCGVFYFGYYQFQLTDDTYAVIFTKLNGWNPDVVKPGAFRIEWEGLIPLNLRMEKFSLKPLNSRVILEGELPSAETYASYLENSPAFNYSFTFDISYIIKPDSLPYLVEEEFLRSQNYESINKSYEAGFSSSAVNFLRNKLDNESYMKELSFEYQQIEEDLMDFLSLKYDYIEFIRFTPVKIIFPDLALYFEGKKQYFEMEKHHIDIQKAAMDKTSTRLVEESAKLELLRKYGAVFTEFPSLLDYFAIFKDDGEKLLPGIGVPTQTQ
jgi:hypothetical protein